MILVLVDGKKATLEVDTTLTDPFFYDPIWEEHATNAVINVDEGEGGAISTSQEEAGGAPD